MKRFWDKVNKHGAVHPILGTRCWIWTAALNYKGYGEFRLDGKVRRAHRVSYEMVVALIPEGLQIDHLCRVPTCVNPAHLEPVTHHENMRRGNHNDRQRRQTHCVRGHKFDEANTYRNPKGNRECRKCRTDASTRSRVVKQ